MPDFGIGEAIAAIAAIGSEAVADVGAGAAAIGGGLADVGGAALGGLEGLGGAIGGGLSSLEAGAGSLFSEAGSGLSSLFGGGAEAAGGGAGALTDPLASFAAPSAAAGGAAPVGAAPIDLASSFGGTDAFSAIDAATGQGAGLGSSVSAFAPTEVGGTQAFPITAGAAQDTLNLGTAESVLPFNTGAGGADLGAFGGATAPGGAGGAGAAGSDFSSLLGGAGKGASDAAGAAGGGGFWSNLGTGAVNSITKNPLGIGAAGLGLGYNLLKGNQTNPNQQALAGQAGALNAQASQLQGYLASGTLPPALQAQLDNATQAAKAKIISGYAARGQNADPSQNSALAQELQQVDINAVAAKGQMETQLLQTGIQETGMSNQLYQFLLGVDQKQQAQTGQAISNFAAALAGGGKGPTIQIGGTSQTA